MADEVYNPNATDGDGDGMVQDGTKFERPVGEQLEGFNPDATDGDGDGLVQDGTEFERPVEAAEAKDDNVITSGGGKGSEEKPALAPVADGVIGSGTTKVEKKPAAKKAAAPKTDTVAIFSDRNLVWQGVGKISKGYNFIPKDDSAKWLTLDGVREVTPEEIKTNLG